ncbi:pyocin knob domain-containing S74 family peptidase [Brucella intermedia]|uniref:pyocin knob domain-containing S74 family peptidase n=1 Tax=Brucella intermedia TaxID=94625 RepID=UPI00224988B7|nr:pyocin knob domain-containing S74 family peptidase [Brucella intermedia]
MAVLPDYVTGTITLAAGSTTVTGTGTMFETAAFRPGDTLQIQNLTAIIASVDGNTSLTLTEPWTGTSLINAPYRARYLPDGARVTAQTTTLIELLGNGNLQALAGVTGAADTLAYFTGSGTMGVTSLTALARTILGRTGGSQIYGDLGEVPNSQFPARLQSFSGSALTSTRDAREFGTYYANTSTTNRPSGSGVGLVFSVPQTSNYLRQFYYDRDTNRAWTCNCVNNVFSAWVEMPSDISAIQINLEAVGAVELGRGLSGDRATFIDFHAEGAPGAVDRSARVVRNAGTNGTFQLSNNGTGGIVLSAAAGVNIPTGSLNNQWAYDNTTVSAANVYLTSSAAFARSTSSGQFKTDVEDLDEEHRDLIMELRPVWYRSLCSLDNPDWSYYGLIAEEVAEIDPRLVHWQTTENQYEEKRSTVTVEDIVTDEVTGEKTVNSREIEIVEQVRNEVELETPRPIGVMYDRLVPHLIAKIQELTARLEVLENRS